MSRQLRHILATSLRALATLVLVALMAIVATGVSPIYSFPEPRPFSGADIYNPYSISDSTAQWMRANLHTHTRIEALTNECEYTPQQTLEQLQSFGYDIVTFSNHNTLTAHPEPEHHVDLYEHGYNLLKFHKHVFGPRNGVWHFDNLLPILASQRQWQIDRLSRECDIVQLNHPLRTPFTTANMMQQLGGYRLVELDSGRSTTNSYWDEALSAGHYVLGTAGDDLHYPDRTDKIARRCTFILTPSAKYEDMLQALRTGSFYSMRLPDYGNGDWEIKRECNMTTPRLEAIGVEQERIFAKFSHEATRIVVYGQGGVTLKEELNSSTIEYYLSANEPYARIVAHFPEGEVIYTNPFARYDSSLSSSPYIEATHTINWTLSVLYNLLLATLVALSIYALVRIWRGAKK